jgi:DNA-binding protein
MTLFKSGQDEVLVKARGRSISSAVDVVEVIRNRFMPNVTVSNISINTEELTNEDGRTSNVSTIEIKIHK